MAGDEGDEEEEEGAEGADELVMGEPMGAPPPMPTPIPTPAPAGAGTTHKRRRGMWHLPARRPPAARGPGGKLLTGNIEYRLANANASSSH
jgi:hypothetical protein